jgi:hypothetical protein
LWMKYQRMRNGIAHIVCGMLLWSSVVPVQAAKAVTAEAALRAQYSDAQFIHIEADAYPQLAEQLRARGYSEASDLADRQVASNATIHTPVLVREPYVMPVDDCNKQSATQPDAGDESIRVMVDISNDMLHSGSGNNRGSAAVVFVVIGTVLIVVWALYVFKYIYDVATGFVPCGRWSDFAFTSSAISGEDAQHARFYGLRYMTGFRDGAAEVGVSVEIGQADILLAETGLPELKGMYWMLGPVLRWPLSNNNNPSYFQMNFLAGSTEHDEMGVIAQANLGLQFGIGNAMRLGVNWGAMNINVHNDQGIASDRERYYYLYGMSVGYMF